VEVRTLVGGEEAAQLRKPERRLATGPAEGREHRLERCPEVAVPVVLAAAQRALAQASHAVALVVQCTRLWRHLPAVEDPPLLDGEQEDHAVHEPKQLVEVVLRRELARGERLTKRGVVRMGEEPLAEGEERGFHPVAQLVPRPRAGLARLLAPGLERALAGRCVRSTEARGVEQEPEYGEVREALFGEDPL